MLISQKELFIQAMEKGHKELFYSLLPDMPISQLGVLRILRKNMKWQHDFILKSLFLKKYIQNPDYIQELLFHAIHNQYELGVKHALNKGASPNDLYKNIHPLTIACTHANKNIIQLLLEHGSSPNPQNNVSYTPINEAIRKLDMEMIDLLKANGAILKQKQLQIGIAKAAKANRIDLVDYFLSIGARIQPSIYIKTKFVNPSALPELAKRDFNFKLSGGIGAKFFSLAARFGHLHLLKEFIKYGRKDTPEADFIKTISQALVTAAGKGYESTVQYLLEQGADTNFICCNKTAYDCAIEGEHDQLAKHLQNLGGKSALLLKSTV
jgi:ankyrin repeat protein